MERVVHTRDLVVNLVSREFHARYKDSALGMIWTIANPLVQLTIYYFIFKRVLDLGIQRYPSFVFIGVIGWTWFTSAINAAVRVLKSNRDIVEQPGFPASILPLVSVSTSMIDFLVALPIVAVIVALEGHSLDYSLLVLPVVMVVQFAFTLGLALLLAGINAAFRDTQHLVVLGLQLYFFVTPVFYDPALIPAEFRPFFDLNPMLHILEGYRAALMHGTMPAWAPLGYVAALSVGGVAVGLRVYEWARYRYLEEL